MNAPWIADMRHMAELDAREERDYAVERLSTHIASDPLTLTTALGDLDEDSPLMLRLCEALSAIWVAGTQATPEQSLVLATAVQGIADDRAAYLYDCLDD